jgi:hypothetical protein
MNYWATTGKRKTSRVEFPVDFYRCQACLRRVIWQEGLTSGPGPTAALGEEAEISD